MNYAREMEMIEHVHVALIKALYLVTHPNVLV